MIIPTPNYWDLFCTRRTAFGRFVRFVIAGIPSAPVIQPLALFRKAVIVAFLPVLRFANYFALVS